MYRALLFDLDGTLAETDSLHLPTWADALRPHGVEIDARFFRENISGRSNAKIARDLLPHLSAKDARDLTGAQESSFRERAHELEPLSGLVDFMEEGRRRGLSLALVTNAPRENAEAVLLALELDEIFDEVVLSDEVGPVKPDPAPYTAALERLGVTPSEALAFEDSTSGIASAVGAGIPTVGIASTQAPQTLEDAGAFMVAEDFTEPELRRLLDL
ncbi:MAG TPA: HAD-IA family hydrolase [Rubrobacteraceae bacterium]|nr:HAD-IA family hydrolase [Rubrobacteraceae bacterium]